jgi:hypothetical protein
LGAAVSSRAGKKQAGAIEESANLQADAARESLELQDRMYREGVQRQQPYYQAGVNALAQLTGRTGTMPAAFQYRPEQLTTDPGYGFRLQEGMKALERSAAARGGLLGGATGKALTRYGQEMASQEYGNAYNRALTEYNALRAREAEEFNRLSGIAGTGGTTAQQINAAGQQYGSAAGNLGIGAAQAMGQGMTGAAQARGSAYMGGVNALTGGLGTYLSYQQNQNLVNQLMAQNQGLSYGAGGFYSPPNMGPVMGG